MSNVISQIVIGIIVTVAGTLITKAVFSKHGRGGQGGGQGGVHVSGPAQPGR